MGLTSLILLLSLVSVGAAMEERGQISSIESGESVIIDASGFPGFYYSTYYGTHYETLMLNFSEDGRVDVGDATYTLKISYGSTALLGDKYKILNAGNQDLLLSKSLVSYGKRTLEIGQDYALGEEYKLVLKDMNAEGALFELQKNSVPVSTQVLKEGGKFEYKSKINGTEYKTITATVDWIMFGESPAARLKSVTQYSENPIEIKVGDEYGEFKVTKIEKKKIELKNTVPIDLQPGREVSILDDFIKFKVAKNVYRAYPYTQNDKVKKYDVRGTAFNPKYATSFSWTADNFGAFFYDLEHNLSTEQINLTVNTATEIVEKGDLVYESTPVKIPYKNPEMMNCQEEYFKNGYYVMGWQGDKFAALGSAGRLSKIIMDSDEDTLLKTGEEWDLGEGYTLTIKDISTDSVYACLSKNNIPVHSTVIKPGASADIGTHTLLYTRNIDGVYIPIVSVYFNMVFMADTNMVELKYPLHFSDSPLEINIADEIGELKVIHNDGKLRLENKRKLHLDGKVEITDDMGLKVLSKKFILYPYISRVECGELIIHEQSLPVITLEEYLIGA